MKEVIISIIGEYMPVLNEEGMPIEGISGIDFTWIAGAAAFLIVLVCFFKLLGVLLRK